ncbi:unnamed protein product, partial [Amoebophrya sp. A25]
EKEDLYAVLSGGAQVYAGGSLPVKKYLSQLERTLEHLLKVQAKMIDEETSAKAGPYATYNFPIFAFAGEEQWFLHPYLLDDNKAVQQAGDDGKETPTLLVDAASQLVIYEKSEGGQRPALAGDNAAAKQEDGAAQKRQGLTDGVTTTPTWKHMTGYLCANLPPGPKGRQKCAKEHDKRRAQMPPKKPEPRETIPMGKGIAREEAAHILYIKGLGVAKDKQQCFGSPLLWRTLYQLGFRKFTRPQPQGPAAVGGSGSPRGTAVRDAFELTDDPMLPVDLADFAAFLSSAGTLRVTAEASAVEGSGTAPGGAPAPVRSQGVTTKLKSRITMAEALHDVQFDLQILSTSGACEFVVSAVGADKETGNKELEKFLEKEEAPTYEDDKMC